MIRKPEKYAVDEILEKIGANKAQTILDGDRIGVSSKRLLNFKKNGTKCSTCGIEALYFVKEKHVKEQIYHLNLYGKNEAGREVLFTRDHIIPKSKGGSDHLENSQTMCNICNSNKGCSIEKKNRTAYLMPHVVKALFNVAPTVISLIVGALFLSAKIYVWAGVFGFLGIYPIAATFTRHFRSGFETLVGIRRM